MTGDREYCAVKILVMVTPSDGQSKETIFVRCVFYYCVVFDGELCVFSIGAHLCAPMF